MKLSQLKKKFKHEDEEKEEKKDVAEATGGGTWFNKGYKSWEGRAQGGGGKFTMNFWVEDGGEATVRFLTSEPVNINEHRIQKNGKYQPRTCLIGTGEKCPLCEAGNKKRFVGVYVLIDRRTEKWTDSQGKKQTAQGRVKIWRCGHRVISQLERLIAKRGKLTGFDLEVSRSGQGTDTTYNFIPCEPSVNPEDKGKEMPDLIKILAPKSRAELLSEGIGAKAEEDDGDVVSSF